MGCYHYLGTLCLGLGVFLQNCRNADLPIAKDLGDLRQNSWVVRNIQSNIIPRFQVADWTDSKNALFLSHTALRPDWGKTLAAKIPSRLNEIADDGAVRLPKESSKRLGISEGDEVALTPLPVSSGGARGG